jgi:hypothetical protein
VALSTGVALGLLSSFADEARAQAPASAPAADARPGLDDPGLLQLLDWMSGAFSSAEQARADSDFLDIRLQMVRIWPERRDAGWLYVEQAVAAQTERPYRQRVYRVSRVAPDTLESAVFELKAPLRFAGHWRTPRAFDAITPDSLERREGCAILLHREGEGAFAGSTRGQACASNHRGAVYATSEVVIRPEGMTSWDRGFDAGGSQVWGAVKGGYVFRKLVSPTP